MSGTLAGKDGSRRVAQLDKVLHPALGDLLQKTDEGALILGDVESDHNVDQCGSPRSRGASSGQDHLIFVF